MSKFNTEDVEAVYKTFLNGHDKIVSEMKDYYQDKKDRTQFSSDFVEHFSPKISEFHKKASDSSIISKFKSSVTNEDDLETFRNEISQLVENLHKLNLHYSAKTSSPTQE